ncbi:MAG TPA: AAA family ATPase [Caulobacteraceae bacterium]|jgi:chromosome partitioning protein|nr:AAA family ATPase [Caulobacteraceae bacterium]
MKTIAVIGRKGGSGKTTIAAHLAIGLQLRGRTVVLADTDPQRSAMDVMDGRKTPGPQAVVTTGPKLFALQVATVRDGVGALVIDTPAVLEEGVLHAVALSDLALLVVRPTFLDLAAAIRTSDIVRRLRKPGLVVLNQAPAGRGARESSIVERSVEALHLLKLPVAPTVIRSRAVYQSVVEAGRSAEELASDPVAALEMKAFCDFIDHLVFGPRASKDQKQY